MSYSYKIHEHISFLEIILKDLVATPMPHTSHTHATHMSHTHVTHTRHTHVTHTSHTHVTHTCHTHMSHTHAIIPVMAEAPSLNGIESVPVAPTDTVDNDGGIIISGSIRKTLKMSMNKQQHE